jgi:hypothetical protein
MKKLCLMLILLASVAVGWLAHGSGSVIGLRQTGKNLQDRSPLRKSSPNKIRNSRENEFQDFTKRIPLLSDTERNSFCENLAPQDRGALIETILKEANPKRLSHEIRSIIDDILTLWVTEDFDKAWAWSQRLSPDAYRIYIAGEILGKLAKKNLTHALALHLEMSAIDPKFCSRVPSLALAKAAGRSAGEFLSILGQIPPHSGSGSGGCEFGKDFDFQQAADGISALLKKHEELPNAFPRNIVSAWAKLDPDAAFAWLTLEDEIGGGGSFRQLLEGIENQGNPGAASAWVASKMEESESSRKKILSGIVHGTAADIAGIVKALPDSNSSDRFLTDLFAVQTRHYLHDFANTLPRMSSPEVRLEAFAQAKKNGVSLAGRFPETAYQTWGITKEQFDAIFPPTKGP